MNYRLRYWGLIVSIILAPFAIASAIFAGLPLWIQWRKQRLLETHFGAEFFDAATIERSTRYYVEPHCVDIDPTNEAELCTRHSIYVNAPAMDRHFQRYFSAPLPVAALWKPSGWSSRSGSTRGWWRGCEGRP